MQDAQAAEELGISNFWQWQLKLLQQEQQHFKDHLDTLQDQIDQEVDSLLGESAASGESVNDQVRLEVEQKHSHKKNFLLNGLRRAILEEQIHMKEQGHKKFRVYDAKYGQSTDWSMKNFMDRG